MKAIEGYLADARVRGLQERSLVTMEGRLRLAWTWLSARGCRSVANVSADDLDAYVIHLVQRKLSRQSIQSSCYIVRGFFRWCFQQGLVLRNPAIDLAPARRGEQPLLPPPLSEAEVQRLIDQAPKRSVVDIRNRLTLELLYGCGLRLSECLALDLDAVDWAQRTLLVHGKGGHERLLPLMTGAWTALQDYLALRGNIVRGPDHGALLLSRLGNRISQFTVREWLRKHSRLVLGRSIHPHLLRHSIAVHLLRGGADVRHVQEFLGHADLDTTKGYLRMVPDELRTRYDETMPLLGG